jgi:hypothetical protein
MGITEWIVPGLAVETLATGGRSQCRVTPAIARRPGKGPR